MKTIHTDILVVGGGSAGIAAAVSASQSNFKVTLVERLDYLGGKATAAEVGTICGIYKYTLSEKTEYVVNGFAKQFSERIQKLSNTKPLYNKYGLHYLPYNIDVYKKLCLDLMQENEVDIHFNAEVIGVFLNDDNIQSIIIKTNNEELCLRCKIIIDCSGNSVISQLAKLPVISSNSYQAAAQIFTLQGISVTSEANLNLILIKELQKAIQNNLLQSTFDRISIVQGSIKNNTVSFKLGIPLPVTYLEDNMTKLRETAVDMINVFTNYFSKNVAAFQNSSLYSIAPEVGVRVGVRPAGKYILTEEDVLTCKKFDQTIANGSWPIEEWGQDKSVKIRYLNSDDFYQIPSGCLISNTISNLLFAGRNISATDGAIASARVMGTCLQTGFAAGILAKGQLSDIPEIESIRAIQAKQNIA